VVNYPAVNFAAAVVIPTFNRRESLRNAIVSTKAQTVPVEIVVMDDGSTDGTAEMIRGEFPDVRFESHKGPNGPSFLRNRGSELATAPVLFPIDDDALFDSPRTVEQTLAEFDHPRVGSVGIPFINVRVSPELVQPRANPGDGIRVIPTYVGASHAVRRDVFLKFGGYRRQLFYMGEEGDFCVRALDAGYVVRLGGADPIHHFESPSRSLYRADFYGRRNDVLFAWHNVPWRYLPVHLMTTTAKGAKFGFGVRRPGRMLKGLASGWLAIPSEARNRRPVRAETYRLFRRLRKAGSLPLQEIEPLLPAVPSTDALEPAAVT
jgi:glycosyltransferase involved in cell wall biosynthesis